MTSWTVRPLKKSDLEAVVEIDRALVGHSRRPYFEKRLASALRAPEHHAQFATERDGRLAGFVLGRALEGEFGRPERALRLESMGVAREVAHQGAGRALLEALAAEARRRDAPELRTSAAWTNHEMLRFLAGTGFRLARSQVLVCPISYPSHLRDEEGESAAHEAVVLNESHIPALARIDSKITGRDRTAYVRRKVEESLFESSVTVSLGVQVDGSFVGFATARVDLGEAGRTEPVAILDTIGVDPAFAGQGIARSLLAQLFMNLHALRVESMETMVAREDFALLQFLYRLGFEPSQRLAFSRPL